MLQQLVPSTTERLRLFNAATFASVIVGCQFVFLLAAPFGVQATRNKVQYLNHMIRSHCH